MDSELDVSEVVEAVERVQKPLAESHPDTRPSYVPARRDLLQNRTASSCRAKAASLRTVAALNDRPDAKAKLLGMADYWDARAVAYENDPVE